MPAFVISRPFSRRAIRASAISLVSPAISYTNFKCGVIFRSTRARLIASSTIGSASLLATIRTDSPACRIPMPLPCKPDWLRTNLRDASMRSSTDFGGLKYEGQRGSGYVSPAAPARVAALAESLRSLLARLHAAATMAVARKTTVTSFTAFDRRVIAFSLAFKLRILLVLPMTRATLPTNKRSVKRRVAVRDTSGWCQRRPPQVPLGRRLERLRRGVDRFLVEGSCRNLQPDRQSGRSGREAHRQHQRRKPARIEHAPERL